VLNNLPCEAIINVIPKVPAGPARDAIGAAGQTSVTVTAAQSAPGAAAQRGVGSEAGGGSSGVKRRAQGLRLGRYLPQQQPGGEKHEDARGGEAAGAEDAAPPDKTP
jgi:hypothetical protein